MDPPIWNLPGLSRFAEDVFDDLREGRNVFIVLPEYSPRGLSGAIEAKLEREDLGPLERISAESISRSSPIYDLHQVYNPEAALKGPLDIRALCRCENFKSRVIWVEDIGRLGEKTRTWLDFLKNYAMACGSQDLLARTVFVVPVRGEICEEDLPVENLLTQHWFWGRISSLDLQIYAAQMVSAAKIEPLENHLMVNVVASLCGHDLAAAENLCRRGLEETSVERAVGEMVAERGWGDTNLSEIFERIDKIGGLPWFQESSRPAQALVRGWSEGVLDSVDGRVMTSPVAEIARGNYEEIALRIWRGHVRSLLPVIDEYRVMIIRYLQSNYRLNFKSLSMKGRDILEIGTIKFLIETDKNLRRKIDKDSRSLIRLLARIRNDLAHLAPISKERRRQLEEAIKAMS